MKTPPLLRPSFCLAALASALVVVPARASLLVNGGFESGLASWTALDQVGSEGSFTPQTGTESPVNALPVPAPPEGTMAAMTDAFGPGSHVLYQDFQVPSGLTAASLSFALFVQNSADDYYAPDHLDFGTPDLNQQARVDILSSAADPFSLASGDILLNLFRTLPGDPLVDGYSSYQFDILALLQAHEGQSLRLRFAEVDNVFLFNLGVDDVRLEAIPEPAGWAVCLAAGCLVAGLVRRRMAPRRPLGTHAGSRPLTGD
jgi:hypothetical protein